MLSTPIIITIIAGLAGLSGVFFSGEDIMPMFIISSFKCNKDNKDNNVISSDHSTICDDEWVIISSDSST